MDCSPPASSVLGILQVRLLEWVAMPLSRGSSWSNLGLPHCRQIIYHLSHQGSPAPQWKWKWSLSVMSDSLRSPGLNLHQAPLSMGFSRQEYRSGLPFPSPVDIPNTGIEPRSPTLQADALPSEPPGKPFFNNNQNCFQCRCRTLINWSMYKKLAFAMINFMLTKLTIGIISSSEDV